MKKYTKEVIESSNIEITFYHENCIPRWTLEEWTRINESTYMLTHEDCSNSYLEASRREISNSDMVTYLNKIKSNDVEYRFDEIR